jgi:hypothetical protein
MNDRCRACGAPCDGDLCDWFCENVMLERAEAARAAARVAAGACEGCAEPRCEACGICHDCDDVPLCDLVEA